MTDTSKKSSRRCSASTADSTQGSLRKPRRWMRGLAVVMAFAAGFGAAEAYVRIQINGRNLAWTNPNITWRLNSAGSDDISDDSHIAAIEHAFQEWEDLSGSNLNFTRGSDTTDVDPGGSSHIVAFDEDNTSGYFPNGSGIVAITPITFDTGSGAILDADILFNGGQYSFSTNGTTGTFDVQDVLSHEIGHLIGLDHSPQVTGTLWPYVSTTQWLHRSLTTDDRSGAIAVAPSGSQSRLTGTIQRTGGGALRGAIVSAISSADGRLIGMAATTSSGAFTIRGVPEGSYWVHVTPLEGGMTTLNLTGNSTVDIDFAPGFFGGYSTPTTFNVTAGNETACGTLQLEDDIALRDNANAAVILKRGQDAIVTIFGSGFTADQMDLASKSSKVTISGVTSASSFVRGTVSIAADAEYGSYDLFVLGTGTEFDAASGVVEVVADAPTITGLSTNSGSIAGGEEIVIHGTGFQDGCYVLFGGLEAQSVVYSSSTALTVTTPAVSAGLVDVAIHNADGQQVTSSGAFTFEGSPVYTALVPVAGNIDGGTTLYITGDNFNSETQVLIDGSPAASVTYRTSTVLQVTTAAHAAGTVDLVLRNAGSSDTTATDAFTYVATADPSIQSFTPGSGPKSGGTLVRIFGTNLGSIASVRFGVDPVSGQGGKLASLVELINGGEVRAQTVLNANAGSYGILVTTETGQGALTAGFTFEEDGSTSGGSGTSLGTSGGGCAGSLNAAGDRATPWFHELPGWALLGFGFAWIRGRLRRRKPVPVPVRTRG